MKDRKQELTKEFMKSDLYEEMRDLLASHGSPKEAIPDLDGQKAIILEYNRYVPELIMDVVNVVRKHERQRILDELEEMKKDFAPEHNKVLDDVKELLDKGLQE